MRLSCIWEGKLDKALLGLYRPDQIAQYRGELGNVLPPHKQKHSLRVGGTLAGLGTADRDLVDAGLFHDYIERGGDIQRAATGLGFSRHTVQLINLLSDENKQDGGDPLGHLQQVLADPSLTPDTINKLIIIKLADRIDNLNRRLKAGSLTKSYLKRSRELAKWLLQRYNGDPADAQILRRRLKELGVRIAKRHLGRET